MDEQQDNQPDDRSERKLRKKTTVVRYEIVEPRLFVTDAELIRRLGVPEKIAYDALGTLDRDRRNTFPQKQALWGNRRYWPSVRHWFDRINDVKPD